jgi:pimeloyl-ACP methyl ester carboxylesterase
MADYVVKGHITGPTSVLTGGSDAPVATVYLHDLGIGEWFWDFPPAPALDFTRAMADAGLVSVSVDELGYGASGRPPGNESCIGAQADVLHQVVQALLTRHYAVAGGVPALRYSKIVVAGHSIGAAIAEVESYSFDDVAGLAVLGYSNQGSSQDAQTHFLMAGASCAQGGGQDGAPGSYAYFETTDGDFEKSFFNASDADPAVMAAAARLRAPAPCGDYSSVVPSVFLNSARLQSFAKPVLLVFGEKDASYPPSGQQSEASNFSGTKDLVQAVLPDTGHAFTLEHTAGRFQGLVQNWLLGHGWVSRLRVPDGSRPPVPVGPSWPALLVKVFHHSTFSRSHGTVSTYLSCKAPVGARCVGSVALQAPPGAREPAGVAATSRFSIPGRGHERLASRVSRPWRAYLRTHASARLRAVVLVTGRSGETIRLTTDFTSRHG